MSQPAIRVEAFDHLVLRCADIERSLAWYIGRLGLTGVRLDEWRAGTVPFPSVRVTPGTIIDLILMPTGEVHQAERNVDHFCVVVDAASVDHATTSGQFDVVDGPGRRYGARGDATSIYVTDPDGNVVELRTYD
jgi:catechol 2,3-dioxygenase-like lactoylglutathione lyase family enzyme